MCSRHESTAPVRRVKRPPWSSLEPVSVIRAFVKLAVLVVLLGLVAGAIALVSRGSRGRASGPVSYDEWPTVPRKPES